MNDDVPDADPAEPAAGVPPRRRRPPSQDEIRGISTIASVPRVPVPAPDPVDDVARGVVDDTGQDGAGPPG